MTTGRINQVTSAPLPPPATARHKRRTAAHGAATRATRHPFLGRRAAKCRSAALADWAAAGRSLRSRYVPDTIVNSHAHTRPRPNRQLAAHVRAVTRRFALASRRTASAATPTFPLVPDAHKRFPAPTSSRTPPPSGWLPVCSRASAFARVGPRCEFATAAHSPHFTARPRTRADSPHKSVRKFARLASG